MATITGIWRTCKLTSNMAFTTLIFYIIMGSSKNIKLIMIKSGRPPTRVGSMTFGTVCSKATGDMIWIGGRIISAIMAAIAVGWSSANITRFMARSAI